MHKAAVQKARAKFACPLPCHFFAGLVCFCWHTEGESVRVEDHTQQSALRFFFGLPIHSLGRVAHFLRN